MNDIKREFQRVFEFIVKHNGDTIPWENKLTKKLIRWAVFYKKIFIVYDKERIAGLAIAWRTTHPENSYEDLSLDRTEKGNFLHVYRVITHPEYTGKGLMFQLLVMGMLRFRGVKHIFWEQRNRTGGKNRLIIQPVERVLQELFKWHQKAKTKHQHPPKSKQKVSDR